MKKILSIAIVALMAAVGLSSCAGSRLTAAEKQQRAQRMADEVVERLDNRRFVIDITYMQPLHGPSKHVDYGFSLEMKGDSIVSYLPYFGVAYNVPYGGGKGLNFTATINNWQLSQPKDGMYEAMVDVSNGEDRLLYRIDVYTDGSSQIDVWANERDPISYTGQMQLKSE